MPAAVAATTLWFALQADRSERWAITAIGAVSVMVPFLLESVGLVPASYAFEGGNLVLLARAVELSPALTIGSLAYTTVTFAILPALFFGGIRDKLAAVERRLHLQAWHLRQLAPTQNDAG